METNPYAPPAAATGPGEANDRYRPIGALGRTLRVLLFVQAGVSLVLAGGTVGTGWLWTQGMGLETTEDPAALVFYFGFGAFAIIAAVYMIVLIVVFSKWICRGHRNIRQFGAGFLRISPRAAVGWFFVPVFSLFKPYQAMKDLWRASHDPLDWRMAGTTPLLPLWWTLWVTTNILDNLSLRLSFGGNAEEMTMATATIDTASALLGIPLCFMAAALVGRITRAQEERVAERGLSRVA